MEMDSQVTEPPLVSIIIPTWNNKDDLLECLSSLTKLNYPTNRAEIIIFNNGSKDSTQETVENYFRKIRGEGWYGLKLIESSENLGAFTGRDEALKSLDKKCEYILFLDDDVEVPDDCLVGLLEIFEEDTKVGIAGAKIVYYDHPEETANGAGFVNWWLGKYSETYPEQIVECDFVITCGCLAKREVIDKVEGFDRDYFTSHGDVDLCVRAKKAGYKVVYNPKIVIRHKVARGGTRTPERTYYVFRNKLFVIKKTFPLPQRWISLTLYSLFWLPKSIIGSIRRNNRFDYQEIKIILKAMTDGWLNRTGRRM